MDSNYARPNLSYSNSEIRFADYEQNWVEPSMGVAYEGCTIALTNELKLYLDNDLFARTNATITLPEGAMAIVEVVEPVVFEQNPRFVEMHRKITAQFLSGVRIDGVVLATYRYKVLPPLTCLAAAGVR